MTVSMFTGKKALGMYIKERFVDARATLAKLPALGRFVDDFKLLESQQEFPSNVVFWDCVWAHSGFGGSPDLPCLQEMSQLDNYIKLGSSNWQLDHAAEKLRSNNLENTLGTLAELMVLGKLATKLGPANVEFEPKLESGKHSDIKLNFRNRPVYLEVTALNRRMTELKLEKIFREVAEHVWGRMNSDLVVHIDIDTRKLVFGEQGIDVEKSVERIIKFLASIKMTSIFSDSFVVDLTLGMAGLDSSKSLYAQKMMVQHYLPELYERIEDDPFRTFAQNVTPSLFVNCPVADVLCTSGPSTFRTVEVADRMVSPSPIAWIERNSFRSHVCRKLKEEFDQLEPGKVNLVVLKAANWTISDYEIGKMHAGDEFELLKRHIEGFLQAQSLPDLSGIAVYEENFSGSRFVLNQSATPVSSVSLDFLEQLVR